MNDKPQTSASDILLKYIPLASVMLIYLGVLKSLVYYRIFGIEILNYISLSEAILFSLDFILIFVIGGVLGVIFSMGVMPFKKMDELVENRSGISKEQRREKMDNLSNNVFKWFYIIIGIGWLIVTIIIMILEKEIKWIDFGLTTIIFGSTMAGCQFVRVGIDKKGVLTDEVRSIIAIGLLLTIYVACDSVRSAELIKTKKPIINTLIVLKENKSIATTDSLIYIGRTDKYTFLYDKNVKASEVISNDEIILTKKVKN